MPTSRSYPIHYLAQILWKKKAISLLFLHPFKKDLSARTFFFIISKRRNFFSMLFCLFHLPESLPWTLVFPILTTQFIKLCRCWLLVRIKFGHFENNIQNVRYFSLVYIVKWMKYWWKSFEFFMLFEIQIQHEIWNVKVDEM